MWVGARRFKEYETELNHIKSRVTRPQKGKENIRRVGMSSFVICILAEVEIDAPQGGGKT